MYLSVFCPMLSPAEAMILCLPHIQGGPPCVSVWCSGPKTVVPPTAEVHNLLSSRANLHLSYNPAGRTHCKLQNHHGYIKHHLRGIGGSPGDIGEVPMT